MAECKAQGCSNSIWSNSFCKHHQYLRENRDVTKSRLQARRKPMRKVSQKRQDNMEKILADDAIRREKDYAFYTEIWNERAHYCYETGVFLGREILTTFFHHILPKEKYPEFRYCKWNIVLLHPDIHNQVETMIEKTPKVKELRDQLLLAYTEGKLPV